MQEISRNPALFALGVLLAAASGLRAAADGDRPADAGACIETGYLTARLYGGVDAEIDWREADLECEGMARPDGRGARLRFAGPERERRLSIIVAIPGLRQGATGAELASIVTVSEEGSGRFYSTADTGNCWTDVVRNEALDTNASRYSIAGTLYCLSPLAEVNGAASVTLSELSFLGRLDWDSQ